MKVCAVTVAYNNPDEFETLLRSLVLISKNLLEGLVVIDNSDKTYLNSNKAIFHAFRAHFKQSEYIATYDNLGSAGGFEFGMRIAKDLDFGWIWLLDQDGTVMPNSLETLISHSSCSELLCPAVVDISNTDRIIAGFRCRKNILGGIYPVQNDNYNLPLTPLDYFGTHGVLIPMSIINRIGYYDKNHFFSGFEDWDFARRVKGKRHSIYLIPSAKVTHPNKWGSSNNQHTNIRIKLNRFLPFFLGIIKVNTLYDERKMRSVLSQNYFGCLHLNFIQYLLSFIYSILLGLLYAVIFKKPLIGKVNLKIQMIFAAYKIQLIKSNYQRNLDLDSVHHRISRYVEKLDHEQ